MAQQRKPRGRAKKQNTGASPEVPASVDEAQAKPEADQPPEMPQPISGTARVELSTGVTLECRAVSLTAMQQVYAQHPRPEPPDVVIDEDSGTTEPNLSDPEFLKAEAEWGGEILSRMHDVYILLGTRPVSMDGKFPGPDSDEWIETLEAVGVKVRREGPLRYLDWVRLWAAPAVRDITTMVGEISLRTGTREVDVAAAAAVFRRPEESGADRTPSPE